MEDKFLQGSPLLRDISHYTNWIDVKTFVSCNVQPYVQPWYASLSSQVLCSPLDFVRVNDGDFPAAPSSEKYGGNFTVYLSDQGLCFP